jgi:HAMP domain-containing protein
MTQSVQPSPTPKIGQAADRPAASQNAHPKGWVSLRWRLVPLALVPVLVVGGAWLGSVLAVQAKENRRLIVQGAVQTASTFSRSILDEMEAAGKNLEDPELRANVQERMRDYFQSQILPLEFMVVVGSKSEIIAAYHRDFDGKNATDAMLTDPVGSFNIDAPKAVAAVTTMASSTLKYARPEGGRDEITLADDGAIARSTNGFTMAGYPLPGEAGATIFGLDQAVIDAQVNQQALTTLALLGAVVLIVLGAASFIANQITTRLVSLSSAADRISLGELEESIPANAKDEIGDLAESIERMRVSLRMLLKRAHSR